MTPKSFFLILIKIMGIVLLYKLVLSCIGVYNLFSFKWFSPIEISTISIAEIITFILIYLILFAIVINFFIIKPNSLIKIFRLDKDFEEEKFEFNIEKTSILRIAVIVIGGVIFVENLPYMISETVKYFKFGIVGINENNNFGWAIYSIVATIIGFLLMTNSKKIVDFILKKEAETEKPNEIL